MNNGRHLCFCVGSIVVMLTLCGCNSNVTYEKTQYVLTPTRPGEPATVSNAGVLEVRRFSIDSAFQGKNLVYRTGDLTYETDFYREFLAPPASMIREATRNWLAQSNRFTRVVDAGEPTYALEANITTLYGDMRDSAAPKAVMELRVFLLKCESGCSPVLLHSRNYTATRDAAAANAEGLVAGFNTCLEAILVDLEQDLASSL